MLLFFSVLLLNWIFISLGSFIEHETQMQDSHIIGVDILKNKFLFWLITFRSKNNKPSKNYYKNFIRYYWKVRKHLHFLQYL